MSRQGPGVFSDPRFSERFLKPRKPPQITRVALKNPSHNSSQTIDQNPGYLFIGDDTTPRYMGNIVGHYKDTVLNQQV